MESEISLLIGTPLSLSFKISYSYYAVNIITYTLNILFKPENVFSII